MRKHLFRVGLLALLIICTNTARALNYGDVTIQITTNGGSGTSSFGYVDFQATIANTGSVPHNVQLIMPRDTSYGYGNYIRQVSRSVTVPAATAATVSMFQLPLRINGNGVTVVIDGQYQRQQLDLPRVNHCQSYHYGGGSSQGCCILLSQQIGYDAVNEGAGEMFDIPGRYSGDSGLSLALSEVPVSTWPRNWLSYSRYSGIMLTGDEWQRTGTEVKRAILEYVSCGGSLTVTGPAQLDASVTALETERSSFKTYCPGFGVIHQTDQTQVSNWTSSDWQTLKTTWLDLSNTLGKTRNVKAANDWFPVIDKLTVPVRGLLLIVLIFAVLIGPANLFVLTRKKRQIWLLWTVPLLSIIASVIVFGYATFAEGWKGFSRTMSVTILDEHTNIASTIGVAAFYCPLTPMDGLHFDYETECTPQVERGYGSGRPRSVDWTDDQHLKSGWVSARVPTHFKVRKSQMRREKIVFSGQSDRLEALNGLGVPVKALYYADAQGNLYAAENIQPGAKIQLNRMNETLPDRSSEVYLLRNLFVADWIHAANTMTKEPYKYLRPNSYIAIVTEPLFVEQALKKQASEAIESVIYGISRGVANAG